MIPEPTREPDRVTPYTQPSRTPLSTAGERAEKAEPQRTGESGAPVAREHTSEGRNHGEAVSGADERGGAETPFFTQAEPGNATRGLGLSWNGPDSDKVETEITVPSECGCLYAPDGTRLKHCGQSQQRAYPYTGEPTMHVFKANGWACGCEGLRPRQRHQQPMDCIPVEALASWRRAHEDVTTSDRTARALMWMELTFGVSR